ncbi:carbohydrate kinase family protein [Lewinella sp. IMCC34191]|uniref:carbohydrate kinase family protein n=1 Tax=Lewinella sp. IMCC34191 TaxID=2259172 RepID=UPI000E23CE79|nr:PfkB family carbohydrate kinase [Lewinella sp. IMCC34191]
MSHPEIICTGELLIELITLEYADTFRAADTYRRYPGGSPANLAANLALLGQRVGLVATVGEDDTGTYLLNELRDRGVHTQFCRRVPLPTTAVLVTKSTEVSSFEVYRSADAAIGNEQIPAEYLSDCQVFHTTAFALSREPARSTILECAARVVATGGRLSIDANYATKVWPDRREALRVIDSYLALGVTGKHGTLAKFSDVDYQCLFQEAIQKPEAAVAKLLDRGAGVVCLTLGERGCYVSSGGPPFHVPARSVAVQDKTGAGDAFWSGFLAGYVAGKDWEYCALAGRAVAERKLVTVGPMREALSLEDLV